MNYQRLAASIVICLFSSGVLTGSASHFFVNGRYSVGLFCGLMAVLLGMRGSASLDRLLAYRRPTDGQVAIIKEAIDGMTEKLAEHRNG